jgi:hypothetical protein
MSTGTMEKQVMAQSDGASGSEESAMLTPELRRTAFATAAEIMRSDGPLQADELNILSTLAATLELPEADSAPLLALMEVLHAPVQ